MAAWYESYPLTQFTFLEVFGLRLRSGVREVRAGDAVEIRPLKTAEAALHLPFSVL